MAKAMVDIQGDFSQMAEFLGSGEGWAETVQTQYYIADLLRAAHGTATKAFDVETAAVAAATKGSARSISHMYEWGTAGINPGDIALNPTQREARLWVHKLGGSGANRSIDFVFRPSAANVPLPQGDWDSDQAPHRRAKFPARPWITEYGVTVVINPRPGSILFIPLGEEGSTSESSYDADRRNNDRFAITPYAVTIPGSKNAGNFSMHWAAWWNTSGKQIIAETAEKIVMGEVSATIKTGRGKGRALRSYAGGAAAREFNIQVSTAKAQAQAQMKQMEDKGRRARYVTEDLDENIGILNGGL